MHSSAHLQARLEVGGLDRTTRLSSDSRNRNSGHGCGCRDGRNHDGRARGGNNDGAVGKNCDSRRMGSCRRCNTQAFRSSPYHNFGNVSHWPGSRETIRHPLPPTIRGFFSWQLPLQVRGTITPRTFARAKWARPILGRHKNRGPAGTGNRILQADTSRPTKIAANRGLPR